VDWITLLPPVLAIGLAIWKKDVFIALISAIFVSETLINGFVPTAGFVATIERIVMVFADAGNTRVLLFSLLIGALLALVNDSGGVNAFVKKILNMGFGKTPQQVGLIPTLTGIFIFIETNMSILTAGILSQSLFDRYKMSRARLAFIIDSTSGPISVLILLNAWGALILSLLEEYTAENSVSILVATIPLNFYALIVLVMVFYTVFTNRVHGTMKTYEQALQTNNTEIEKPETSAEETPTATKARYMVIPILCLISGMLLFMFWTGDGDIMAGSGSKSVLYATSTSLLVAWLLLRIDNQFKHRQLVEISFKGMSHLLPLVLTVLLALALGASLKQLGTGQFVAGLLTDNLPIWSLAAIIFIASGIISFTTGTSWGTFSIMVPIAMPLALSSGLPPALLLSAVIGGGVFGDHCSPISDTTIISSLGADCDHLDHVSTQLPYALTAGAMTVILYIISATIMI